MSIESVVHELIEVVAGRHPVLSPAEADALHEAVDYVEGKPEPPASDDELSQEPILAPALPDAPPAPENPAEDVSAPQGNL